MVYFARIDVGTLGCTPGWKYPIYFIKIGYAKNIGSRMFSLKSYFKLEEVELLKTLPGDRKEERELHEKFSAYRFMQNSGLEWFYPVNEIWEFIGRTPPNYVEALGWGSFREYRKRFQESS